MKRTEAREFFKAVIETPWNVRANEVDKIGAYREAEKSLGIVENVVNFLIFDDMFSEIESKGPECQEIFKKLKEIVKGSEYKGDMGK